MRHKFRHPRADIVAVSGDMEIGSASPMDHSTSMSVLGVAFSASAATEQVSNSGENRGMDGDRE